MRKQAELRSSLTTKTEPAALHRKDRGETRWTGGEAWKCIIWTARLLGLMTNSSALLGTSSCAEDHAGIANIWIGWTNWVWQIAFGMRKGHSRRPFARPARAQSLHKSTISSSQTCSVHIFCPVARTRVNAA